MFSNSSALLVFLGSIFTLFSVASAEVPESPLTPKFTQCHTRYPVTVCRYQSEGATGMLKVFYNGFLHSSANDQVSVWIKLNGRYGMFRLSSMGSRAVANLSNGALNCALCTDDESGSVICPFTTGAESRWICTEAPKEMKEMFFWAVNSSGKLNDWDIELAFVSGQEWDSLYGQNYRFRLE